METKQEIQQLFNNMMELSGKIVNISPIYKKDMSNYEDISVQWRICGVEGYQIFKEESYSYKIGEKLKNPDIYIVIYKRDLAKRFLSGEKVRYYFPPRRDYKGKFKVMQIVGFKDIETENLSGNPRITKRFMTVLIHNDIFKHPFSLFILPPFQIHNLITKKPERKVDYGAYIPINQSLGTYENHVIPYVVFEHFIEKASNIVLMDCGCRVWHDCQNHDHSLGCFFIGDDAVKLKLYGLLNPRIITKEEALDIVRRAIDDGLIPVIGSYAGGTEDYGVSEDGYILRSCFCCTCCCVNAKYGTYGPLTNLKFAKIDGLSVTVENTLCKKECRHECAQSCVFRGIEVIDDKAKINTERCIGCGRCASACPNGAIKIEIDDISRVNEIIRNIEAVVDVRDQASLKH